MPDRTANEHVSAAPQRDWVEIVAAVLLALAAVATGMEQLPGRRAGTGSRPRASSRTNAIRIEATRAATLAEAETEIDVATYIQWIDAHASNDTALKDSTASASGPSSSRRSMPGSRPGHSPTQMPR